MKAQFRFSNIHTTVYYESKSFIKLYEEDSAAKVLIARLSDQNWCFVVFTKTVSFQQSVRGKHYSSDDKFESSRVQSSGLIVIAIHFKKDHQSLFVWHEDNMLN